MINDNIILQKQLIYL